MTHDEQIEKIVDWFFDNFEDPVQNMPWDEGEYVYIWGGPFDTADEISDAFGDTASESAITEAINRVHDDGAEWAPHQRRIGPEISSDPVVAAKQNLYGALQGWLCFTGDAADPDTDRISVNVRDVVTLLSSHRDLKLKLESGAAGAPQGAAYADPAS
jgi:hypothetical protein